MHDLAAKFDSIILYLLEMQCRCLEASYQNSDVQLKSSDSPKTFMQNMLYGEKSLPEGSVPHLLAADDTVQEELWQILKWYANIFPSQLPKDMPRNRGLGEVHEIHTKPRVTSICYQ